MSWIKENDALDAEGKEIDLWFFQGHMYHEDWHEVERMDLVLISPPEDEDDSWLFSRKEDEKRAKLWLVESLN